MRSAETFVSLNISSNRYPFQPNLLPSQYPPLRSEASSSLRNLERHVPRSTLGIVQVRVWKWVGEKEICNADIVGLPTSYDVHIPERVRGKVMVSQILHREVDHEKGTTRLSLEPPDAVGVAARV